MSDQRSCSFCGSLLPVANVVEGPGDVYICLACARQRIIAAMNKEYRCSFCGVLWAGHLMAEGPGDIHICVNCAGKAMGLLMKRV